jgi:hypothetical protein
MVWSNLQKVVEKALHYSTPLGTIWLFLLFTFRMFIFSVVGGSVYGDESSNFKCDTNQPGCQNVCFNRFSPISHMRFWAFQMMFVCLPSLCFMTFAQFEEAKISKIEIQEEKLLKQGQDDESTYYSQDYMKLNKKKEKFGLHKKKTKTTITKDGAQDVVWTPRIRLIYVVHLIFKLVIEAVFLYFSYILQKQQSKKSGMAAMWVPEKYECTHGDTEENSACSQNPLIPCWVSRPWEKTIFMLYMTSVTVISILLCLMEFVYVLTRTTRKSVQRRAEGAIKSKSMIDPMFRPNGNANGTIASSMSSCYTSSSKKKIHPNGKANGNGHVPNGKGNGYPDLPPYSSPTTPLIEDEPGKEPQKATAPAAEKVLLPA